MRNFIIMLVLTLCFSCGNKQHNTETTIKVVGNTQEVTQMMRVTEIGKFQTIKNMDGTTDIVRPVVLTNSVGIHWEADEFSGDASEELEVGDLVYVTVCLITDCEEKIVLVSWVRIDYAINPNDFKQKGI